MSEPCKLQRVLGNNIRFVRKRLHFTQEALAKQCGISVSHLGEIENGKRYPSAKLVEALAASLNCQPAQLFAEQFALTVDEHYRKMMELHHTLRSEILATIDRVMEQK